MDLIELCPSKLIMHQCLQFPIQMASNSNIASNHSISIIINNWRQQMGIHKLMDLIREHAQSAIKSRDLKYFSGMTVALDASMSMYQFLVSTQGVSSDSHFLTELTDKDGNKTGHLLGLFNRTILLLQHGIKPVWVFDGPPPKRKNGQILRRKRVKQQALQKKQQAEQVGNLDEALKQQQRTTYISHTERQDVKKMLTLMGVPVIQAPGEAEAQCSYLNKIGKVDAVCTEDTDSIVFGTQLLLRELNNKKQPITEITREKILEGLGLTEEEFVDMCILCGCDYASKIEGIGPVKAYKFIKEFKNIQKILQFCQQENQQKERYKIPKPDEFDYEQVRNLFKNPNVLHEVQFKFEKNIDQEALKAFLVGEKGFSQQRVESGIKKIKASSKGGNQVRLEAFFGKPVVTKSTVGKKDEKLNTKGKKSIKR